MRDYTFEIEVFRQANAIARKHGTVLLASGYLAQAPISELAQSAMLDGPVYSRGMADLTIEDAGNILDECVFPLEPGRIIVALGSEELKEPGFNPEDFMAKYEWLLYTINSRIKCKICIASVISKSSAAGAVNAELSRLAASTGCQYIDISHTGNSANPLLKIMSIIRSNTRDHSIGFTEAMSLPV